MPRCATNTVTENKGLYLLNTTVRVPKKCLQCLIRFATVYRFTRKLPKLGGNIVLLQILKMSGVRLNQF